MMGIPPQLAEHIEETDGVEILSMGNGLELIKDLGDAADVAGLYGLNDFHGTHAIGHTRMATESDVDIRSAHPYWAFPTMTSALFITARSQTIGSCAARWNCKATGSCRTATANFWRFIPRTIFAKALLLKTALRKSIEEIDGVFTYLVATKDQLGMAKDTMAAKPLVLYESDDMIAMASEEVAIRAILPQEIDTTDPYDEEVRVWQA